MGIISKVLSLFGRTDNGKKDGDKLQSELLDQLTLSMEAFEDRQIYKVLTEQNIDSIFDDNLLLAILDNLSEKLPADYEKEYETVISWNKSRRAIYLIWALEAEVNNGGYNQYYFNPSGQFYNHLPEALKLIGAPKFADLTKRANNIYEKENAKITQYQDGSLEGFSDSYEDNPLNEFDDEFYDLSETENLQQIQIDYIRMNKMDFVDI